MRDECRIAIVGVEPIFRDGVVQTLSCDQGFVVAAQGTTGQDAEHVASEHGLDVLLLEAAVPGSLAAARNILSVHQNVKVIFFASGEDEEHASQALQIGVHGYMLKTIAALEFVHAIATVHAGGRYISHDLSWRLVTSRAPASTPPQLAGRSQLSLREQQIVEYTLMGLTNLQIAHKLGRSLSTTKYHKSMTFKKLGVRNRLGVIAKMNEIGMNGGLADSASSLRQ
jgi:DNA-binding NarL/FixJ family response regulator